MTTTLDSARPDSVARGSNAQGIAAMVWSMGCFVSSDTLIKIVGRDMPVGQIMFIRGLMAAALMAALAIATGVMGQLHRTFTKAVAARSFTEVASTILFFTGVVQLPFADASAIGQFTPLRMTAGAALFLNEPVGWRRWLATLVGFAGVMLIIRPGSSTFNPAGLLIVACVLFVIARDLITRQMDPTLPIPLLIFVSALAISAAGLGMKVFESWVSPDLGLFASLAVSALGVCFGYYGAIVSMRCGEIAVVAPFRYTAMLFALAWGYLLFGEIPDRLTWCGIAIVIIAGVYMFHRESVRRREAERAMGLKP